MVIDALHSRGLDDGRVERSARLRWTGGSFRLRIAVPEEHAAAEGDASPFVAVTLLLAMSRHEDLWVDGGVSPRLLRSTRELQRVYSSWSPELRACTVRAAAEAEPGSPAPGVGSFFSRGVDSLFSAIQPREGDEALTHLVFSDTLDPQLDERSRAEHLALTREAAEVAGLPLVRVSTNLRDPAAQVVDYADLSGAGLAFIALTLAGALGRALIPSTWDYASLGPFGSHPLLDPLFSSERVEVVHDSPALGRLGKVRAIVRERPDLLPYLKPCQEGNRAGNCGVCRKCVWTMLCLSAEGALEQATGFPDRIDPRQIGESPLVGLSQRLQWAETAAAIDPRGELADVRREVDRLMRRLARPGMRRRARAAVEFARGRRERPDPAWESMASRFLHHHTEAVNTLFRDGRLPSYGPEAAYVRDEPAWEVGPIDGALPPPPEDADGQVGLLRLVHRRERRHLYAAGKIPGVAGAERVGELGALLREDPGDGIPVWVSSEGRVSVTGRRSATGRKRPLATGKWILAPARWSGLASPAERALESVRRAVEAVGARRPPDVASDGPPAGWLHAGDGQGRLPLFLAVHPVTGDQLLTTRESDPGRLGYGAPERLGWLDPVAPVSGVLDPGRPLLPWAARMGTAV